ncbi:8-oxo-dGTP pyrophosphatase MutT, NUDIX family [Arboricoccus pini]|uniref:8-oxo-dGTP pyrophosphatase MutT, NUDIX family n=2 Tax=Arboricoccus pini TaxID=1963835 RepID=A0A212S4Z3_9PROT|nr:NUDIX hydrolase [Arboricoccus pini]SNB80117.1 8-oxo-dGTP pyrophosphatase MutT, NUDIX family [Arboricoccus pini]
MPRKAKQRQRPGQQFAALPVKNVDGETLVLLVTSRETGRWVLPKGWREKNLSGPELAAKEAYEEAGIVGVVQDKPIGSYGYLKRLPKGQLKPCLVKVFPMRVDDLLDTWPEARQRRRQWFTFAQAALNVDEAELVELFLNLAKPVD